MWDLSIANAILVCCVSSILYRNHQRLGEIYQTLGQIQSDIDQVQVDLNGIRQGLEINGGRLEALALGTEEGAGQYQRLESKVDNLQQGLSVVSKTLESQASGAGTGWGWGRG